MPFLKTQNVPTVTEKIIVLQNRKSACSARKKLFEKVVDKSKKLRYNKGEPKENFGETKNCLLKKGDFKMTNKKYFYGNEISDYGMENGEVVYKCRQALLFYTLRLLRLSPDDDVDNDDPKKNQIILKNKDEIFMLLRM